MRSPVAGASLAFAADAEESEFFRGIFVPGVTLRAAKPHHPRALTAMGSPALGNDLLRLYELALRAVGTVGERDLGSDRRWRVARLRILDRPAHRALQRQLRYLKDVATLKPIEMSGRSHCATPGWRASTRVDIAGLRCVALVILVALPTRWAYANDLLEFYRVAVTHDSVLQAAISQRDAAIEARPQALSRLLPQFSVGASAGRERAGYALPVAPSRAENCVFGDSDRLQHCYTNTHAYGLTLTQTLWSFESFNRLKEASVLAASAEANLLGVQQTLLLRLASAYFQILSAQDQLATNRRARDAFGTLLHQAQIREQTGIGPRSAVAQAQSFYDATDQSVIDAESAADDARLALTEIIGRPVQDIAPLREDIPLTAPDPASVDPWVVSALRDNPRVRAAQLQAQAADRDIAVQQGASLPNITLNASSSHGWQGPAFGGNQTLDMVGISFNWPLFQGGAVASAVRQSRALYRQAQALYDSAQRDTERQTRASYRGVVTGIARIHAAQRAVESGREAVEASQRNVDFGAGSVFDLLNAQNNYYAAQRAYSQTRYDYLTALLTLKQQAGTLTEQDLEAVDALLVEKSP